MGLSGGRRWSGVDTSFWEVHKFRLSHVDGPTLALGPWFEPPRSYSDQIMQCETDASHRCTHSSGMSYTIFSTVHICLFDCHVWRWGRDTVTDFTHLPRFQKVRRDSRNFLASNRIVTMRRQCDETPGGPMFWLPTGENPSLPVRTRDTYKNWSDPWKIEKSGVGVRKFIRRFKLIAFHIRQTFIV